MDTEENVHRLEGTTETKGGLIIKKKPPTFKVPQPSLLGLDRLAAKKRREKEETARKMSFNMEEDDAKEHLEGTTLEKKETQRKFRSPQEETPTYTGGLSKEAKERFLERMSTSKQKEKGVYATTKSDDKKHDRSRDYDKRSRGRERDRDGHSSRDGDRDRNRRRHKDRYLI